MSTERLGSRPRKDQQRNRAALITAAFTVFAEQGIEAPLDAIAKRAGLANATLYRHFPERRDLLLEVLAIELTRNDEALTAAAGEPSGWEGLCAYLRWNFAEQIQNPAQLSALRAVPVGQHPETDVLRYRTVAKLQALFDQAKRERSLRADRWIEDVYLFMSANERIAQAGHADPQAASARLLDLALASLRTVPEPEVAAETPIVLRLRETISLDLGGLPPEPPKGNPFAM